MIRMGFAASRNMLFILIFYIFDLNVFIDLLPLDDRQTFMKFIQQFTRGTDKIFNPRF